VLDPLTGVAYGLADLERRNYRVRLPPPKAQELAAITERFNALAHALDAARAENEALNHRLITAQDDERKRTALELHDEVGPESGYKGEPEDGRGSLGHAAPPHQPETPDHRRETFPLADTHRHGARH
jgi:hypothetical protein